MVLFLDKLHLLIGSDFMIIYLLCEVFFTLLFFLLSLFPTIETPVYLVTSLPQILRTIMGFNLYLPVYEAIIVVIFCLGVTLGFRAFSVLVSIVGISV